MSKKPRQPRGKSRATVANISTRDALVAEINAFLERTGVAPTVFGVRALNDPGFVVNVRNGADVKTATLDKVRLFMAKYEEKKSLAAGAKSESGPVPIRLRA